MTLSKFHNAKGQSRYNATGRHRIPKGRNRSAAARKGWITRRQRTTFH
jgi:hypothetical protein